MGSATVNVESLVHHQNQKELSLMQPQLIYGKGDKMLLVEKIIHQVANTDITILIRGESGTGKELIAREIVSCSARRNEPFVKVNCAAIPSELMESELFGYEKGAFTGALNKKPGKFEQANQGTIFLDEVSEVPLDLQAKLLHVLQDKEYSRLGGIEDIEVDVRVITATNRNLEDALRSGHFREDLYYRINVVSIHLPPLRERKEDLPELVEYFLNKYSILFNRKKCSFSKMTMNFLVSYHWPGNIRQLENVIKKSVILEDEASLLDELLHSGTPLKVPSQSGGNVSIDRPSLKQVGRLAAREAERQLILSTLMETRWNRRKAAELLDISYKALLYKIKQNNIVRKRDSLHF